MSTFDNPIIMAGTFNYGSSIELIFYGLLRVSFVYIYKME